MRWNIGLPSMFWSFVCVCIASCKGHLHGVWCVVGASATATSLSSTATTSIGTFYRKELIDFIQIVICESGSFNTIQPNSSISWTYCPHQKRVYHVIQRIIERSTGIVWSTCMEERQIEIKVLFGCKPLFNPMSGYRMILQTTGGSSNCFSSQPNPPAPKYYQVARWLYLLPPLQYSTAKTASGVFVWCYQLEKW